MEGQVPAKVKKQRHRRLMALQQKISHEIHERYVGRTLRVLVECEGVARSHADAPEIDGTVRFTGAAEIGQFCDITITGAAEYDLTGETLPRASAADSLTLVASSSR
jgi:ribosomal protein S12 methylthiotransferase